MISFTTTSKDSHGQDLRLPSFQMDLKVLSQKLQLLSSLEVMETSVKPLTQLPLQEKLRTELMRMFKVSLTRTLIDSTGQDLRSLSSQTDLRLLSHHLSTKDIELETTETSVKPSAPKLSLERRLTVLMRRFTVLLTPWSIELTGTDPKSHSCLTDLRLLSHLPSINTEDTTETSVRPSDPKLLPERKLTESMKKFTVLPTPWLIELTGTDPKSHSSLTDPRLLSHLPFTNTEETTETSVRPSAPKLSLERRLTVSMPKFTDSPTPWSTESTGTDPRSLSSLTDPRSPSQLPSTNIMLTNTLTILLTRR